MPRSVICYACGALAGLALLVLLSIPSNASMIPAPRDSHPTNRVLSDILELPRNSNLTGPQWISVSLPSLPALARHKAVIVEMQSGEVLCAIGGDLDQAYCYPLKASGELDESGVTTYTLDAALRFHAATVVGDRMYILGGNVDVGPFPRRDVYCMQYDGGKWNRHDIGLMKRRLMQHAVVTVNNRVYVIGGYERDKDSDSVRENYMAEVWSADVGTSCVPLDESSWRPENSLRTRDGSLYQVAGHAAVSVMLGKGKKFIYVIGGFTKPDRGFAGNTVLRAQVGDDGVLGAWNDLGAVPGMTKTWLLTAAVSGRYLYVIGGASLDSHTSSAKVYRAYIDDNGGLAWLDQAEDLPIPLHAHATATSKAGRMYIVGGMSNRTLQNKIYYTPLLDFEQQGEPRGPVTYGDTISYTLRLANLGVRDLVSLTITDSVQVGISATLGFHIPTGACQVYSYADNTIICSVPELPITATKELTFQVAISQPTLPLSVPQMSQASFTEEDRPVDTIPTYFQHNAMMTDPFVTHQAEQAHFSSVLAPNAGPDLGLQKSGEQPLVVAGLLLTYTLVVNNYGPSPASNVVVTDTLPNSVTFEYATPPQDSIAPPRWSLGTIPAHESQTIRLTVWVDPGSSDVLTNTAVVNDDKLDPYPSNNQAQAWTVVVRQADLSISKDESDDPVMPGGTLTYTLIVSNAGPSNAQGVVVTDTLPDEVRFVSATLRQDSGPPNPLMWNLNLPAGQSQQIQVVVTVTTNSTGTICNRAGVSSTIDPNLSNNIDQECTAIYRSADLQIKKVGDPDPIVVAGGSLTYTLVVTNAGPWEATNVLITDSLPVTQPITIIPTPTNVISGAVIWHISELEPNEHMQFILVVQTDPGSVGELVNEAEVSSDVPDSSSGNNKARLETGIGTMADLRLEKTRTPELVIAGTALTYTLAVCNAGPSTAVNVNVTDWLPADTQPITIIPSPAETTSSTVTWYISTLQAGNCAEFQLVLQVDPSATGALDNVALATSSTPDNDRGNNIDRDHAILYKLADLNLEKYGDPDTVNPDPTAVVTYTLVVTNAGPSKATNVIIADSLPATQSITIVPTPTNVISDVVTWQISELEPNEHRQFDLVVQVDSCSMGTLVNEAEVSSDVPDPDLGNNKAGLETGTNCSADLQIRKVSNPDPIVIAGERLTYTLVITNVGPSETTNVIITDSLPITRLDHIVSTVPTSTNEISGVVTWQISELEPNEHRQFDLVVQVDSGSMGTLVNEAEVNSDVPDPDLGNNKARLETGINRLADLQINKAGNPDPIVIAGERLTYTLVITNVGPSETTNVIITDSLPTGTLPISITPPANEISGVVTWHIPELEPNEHRQFVLVVQVDFGSMGTLVNEAEVNSDVPDPDLGNNKARLETGINCLADLQINKAGNPDPIVIAGERLTYTLVVSNAGPSNALGVVVTDMLPSGVNFVSATLPQDSGPNPLTWKNLVLLAGHSQQIQVVVSVNPNSTGTLCNEARVSSDVDPNLLNNVAGKCTATDWADLRIEKMSSPDQVVLVGERLTYTLVVTNGGPLTATNVIVTDSLPTGTLSTSIIPPTDEVSGIVTWHIPELEPDAYRQFVLVVQVGPCSKVSPSGLFDSDPACLG